MGSLLILVTGTVATVVAAAEPVAESRRLDATRTHASATTAGEVRDDLPADSTAATQPATEFPHWPGPAALSGALATDRPGFSDTAFLVPRGHAHVELGFGYTCDHEDQERSRTASVGATALRVGVLDDLELRIKWGGMSLEDTHYPDKSPAGRSYIHHENIDGATDMSVGFKLPVLRHSDSNLLPNLSLIPSISLPTGSDTKTSGDVDPALELAWNYPITGRLTLYGTGAIASVTDSDGRFAQSSGSLAAGYALTDRLSFFVEYFGIYPNTRSADCQHNINGGPVFLINNNVQIDFAVGMGLNEESPDFFANVGLSIRF